MARIILACLVVSGAAAVAEAHGRPASLNSLHFDSEDPKHLIAQATWGAGVSRDGGVTWSWICASAFGVDPFSEDPSLQIGSDGRAVFGTFRGLIASDPTGCSYDFPEPSLEEVWATTLERHPTDPSTLYALSTEVPSPDRLWRSPDGGTTWVEIGASGDDELFDGMAIAPSDSNRIYIGGATFGGDRRFFLFRSDDGGSTIEDLGFGPIEGGENLLLPTAVDPLDPDLVYAVVLHFNGEDAPERLVRTEDGGQSWATVARIPQITDVVTSPDGTRVWTGSKLGGVYRSDDRGKTFRRVHASLPVRCLTLHDNALYACVDQSTGGFALGRSIDGGESWVPLVKLEDINQMHVCSEGTEVATFCPFWASLVAEDLGFELASGTEPSSGCAAFRGVGIPSDGWVLAWVLAVVVAWRRRYLG